MGVTIKDIAKRTGLGIATISKYLNGGRVLDKNRALIEQAIREMNYTVNEAARNLKTRRSGNVGLIIPALNNVFMMEIVNQIQLDMHEKGWGVLLYCNSSGDMAHRRDQEKQAVRFMLAKGVDGVINMPMNEDGSHLQELLGLNMPITLFDKQIPALASQVSAVIIDNVGAGRLAADELLNAGHRKIVAAFGVRDNYTAYRRYEGFADACRQRGLNPEEQTVLFSDGSLADDGMNASVKAAVRGGATAVLASSAGLVKRVMRLLDEEGWKVPQDVSVMGFDITGPSFLTQPVLTSIVQPTEKIGAAVAEIMCDHLKAVTAGKGFVPQLRTLSARMVQGASIRKV